MKDIKELIHAAVEENALKFQELVNAQLQVRAYDAIEALRPEVGASMFGESSHKKMDDEEMDDEEEMEDEDEDEMDDKKKSMKEALHPNQQKIDVVDDEKIDAKDFAKLRKMKKMKEEVEVDEAVRIRDRAYSGIERGHGDDKTTFQGKMDRMHIAAGAKARRKRTGPGVKGFNSAMRPAKASDGYQPRETGSVRAKNEEVVNEVAMPKNAADWQALITHQIQTVGHPVATDAQFRAQHGKDTSKIASLEPGEDKVHYAAAQGGTVKA